jgi:cytochrome P450
MINEISANAYFALYTYLGGLAARKRKDPGDDLISDLCDHLEDEALAGFCTLLYAAGTETVGRMLGNAAVLFAEHPDQRALLVDEPDLVPSAVEELLRFEPPSPVQGRWTTAPVEWYGVEIPADSKVLLLTGSAGRDDRVYPDPDRFDVRRDIGHHLSFGYGVHQCLGQHVARLMMELCFTSLFARFPALHVVESDEPIELVDGLPPVHKLVVGW